MNPSNPFTSIPPRVRLWLYLLYGLATLAVSSVGTYQAALHHPVPDWAVGAGAVLVPIGVALAATAASNTPNSTTPGVSGPLPPWTWQGPHDGYNTPKQPSTSPNVATSEPPQAATLPGLDSGPTNDGASV